MHLDACEPTCTEPGNSEGWICAACGQGFTDQTASNYFDGEFIIPALGHDWGEITYEWSEDNRSVTATHICLRNEEHTETETANVLAEISIPATCEEMGETTYTAMFDNEAFDTQIKKAVNIPSLGHDWGAATYEWSEDNMSVTAVHACVRDESHVETVTVASVLTAAISPSDDVEGSTLYTAVFEPEGFEEQSKIVEGDIPALNTLDLLLLPDKLTTIDENAFTASACEGVIIPDGCETIGSRAFSDCVNLIYVRIPASVTFIAEDAFEGCLQVRIDRIK